MVSKLQIEYLLYGYLYICAALLLFNMIYILGGGLRSGRQRKRISFWKTEIFEQLSGNGTTDSRHEHLLSLRLKKIHQLMAYGAAAECLEQEYSAEELQRYFVRVSPIFQNLASWYVRQENMERAYFAWFVARFRPYRREQHMFRQMMVDFLENSTVYCRENTLKALYSSGDTEAVICGLRFMNDHAIFHHPKLLADGLRGFQGDEEELAKKLWGFQKEWNAKLMTGVVQFITECSGRFQKEFLQALKQPDTDREIRLSLLRYFRRYPYEQAREFLHCAALENDGEEMAIVAAFVLDQYPGEDTVSVLKRALCSGNWYIRVNAASSLIHLGVGEAVKEEMENSGDRYAREMIEYQLQRQKKNEEGIGK